MIFVYIPLLRKNLHRIVVFIVKQMKKVLNDPPILWLFEFHKKLFLGFSVPYLTHVNILVLVWCIYHIVDNAISQHQLTNLPEKSLFLLKLGFFRLWDFFVYLNVVENSLLKTILSNMKKLIEIWNFDFEPEVWEIFSKPIIILSPTVYANRQFVMSKIDKELEFDDMVWYLVEKGIGKCFNCDPQKVQKKQNKVQSQYKNKLVKI